VSIHPAKPVLDALEALLKEERGALVRLDREAIEAFATQKLELDTRLRACAEKERLGPAEGEQLRRVRALALSNQLLLAHARSCVQGVLSLLHPEKAPGYSVGPASATPPPVALNFRG
jgi:hypothetical protein